MQTSCMYSSSCDNIVSRMKQLVAIGVVVSPSIVRKVRPMSVDSNDESLDELLLAVSQLVNQDPTVDDDDTTFDHLFSEASMQVNPIPTQGNQPERFASVVSNTDIDSIHTQLFL